MFNYFLVPRILYTRFLLGASFFIYELSFLSFSTIVLAKVNTLPSNLSSNVKKLDDLHPEILHDRLRCPNVLLNQDLLGFKKYKFE